MLEKWKKPTWWQKAQGQCPELHVRPSIPWALLRYTPYRELALRQVPWKGFVYIGSSRVTYKNSEADSVLSPLFG